MEPVARAFSTRAMFAHRCLCIIDCVSRLSDLGDYKFQLKQRLDVYDDDPVSKKWMEGAVADLRDGEVKVHFQGFAAKFDLWLPVDSIKISPFGLHTKPKFAYMCVAVVDPGVLVSPRAHPFLWLNGLACCPAAVYLRGLGDGGVTVAVDHKRRTGGPTRVSPTLANATRTHDWYDGAGRTVSPRRSCSYCWCRRMSAVPVATMCVQTPRCEWSSLSCQAWQSMCSSVMLPVCVPARPVGPFMSQAAYEAALAAEGLSVRRVLGDGNCMFRSFSHQVYGTEEHVTTW